jgi:hypothetical protein
MKATDEKKAEEKSAPGAAKSQRAEDKDKMQSPKSKSSENESKGTKDMKAEGREGKDMKAEGRDTKMNAEQKGAADSKSTTTQSQTTGQAGAGGKLSTEQRTRITSVIRDQHVQPLNNVNFSIAVGTRVPRDVRFYPLPREVVTIYPEWRGYEFVLVHSQIIVIDPKTFEIVAILEA